MIALQDDIFLQLKNAIRGEVLLPNHERYEETRKIWNGMIDRRPSVIVQCAGVADVMEAVRFAREQHLQISVRGGGHNIAGLAVCDDALMIDLSRMRTIWINPETQRAQVGPGATLADFDHEAQAFGLATPLGINSTTGVAGLTLGGGFGWLSRQYGLTIDNLLSADVVTADGRFLRCNAQQHQDLFWAIRGGGGNFGIVTEFEFQLHPVGPQVYSGLIVYPIEQARQVMQRYRDFVEKMPMELNVWLVLRKAPPLPFLPQEIHGKEILALALFYAGELADAEKHTRSLHTFGMPVGAHVGLNRYVDWQKAFDPLLTPGARNYWKSHNLEQLSDEAIDTAIAYTKKLPSDECEIFFGHIGGYINTLPVETTAYPHRTTKFAMNVHGRWSSAAEDEGNIAWARNFFQEMMPYASGSVYVNFMTADETDRIAAAYGPNYERLVRIKDQYDPQNIFCLNQNIKPSMKEAL